jgi:hypothetical protein
MFVGKGIRNFFLVNSKKLICFRFENFSSLWAEWNEASWVFFFVGFCEVIFKLSLFFFFVYLFYQMWHISFDLIFLSCIIITVIGFRAIDKIFDMLFQFFFWIRW